ncbi:hypothetical protein F4811DRAFT_215237 [Daldinia bambusicola]|nr:hypothetical protein F4811DRAFT_215237 [Daldinia bambusicola]
MWCPFCRTSLLYKCGDIISRYFLRPGVTILPEELQTNCPLYQFNIDAHLVPRVGRPLNPDTLEMWQEVEHQMGILGGQELINHGHVPWEIAHPGSNLFHEDDDDPYKPPNIIPTDGELHMNIPTYQEDRRYCFAHRPKKHNFRFTMNEEMFNIPPPFMFARSSLVIAIENEWPSIVNAQIGVMRSQFEKFRSRWPNVTVSINPTAFSTLIDLYTKLKIKYVIFRRQHEGFIELSPVAIRYRDAAQNELQMRLEDFWEKYEWVRRELDEAVENVSL